MVDMNRVMNTLGKMDYYLSTHSCVCVGVSGGSDSTIIVHMIATKFPQYLNKVHFVFQDTGLEYNATKRHLVYMADRYGVNIERVRGDSVVTACRTYGVPMISKEFSQTVYNAQRGYPSALKKVNGEMIDKDGNKSRYNLTPKQKALALYLIENNIPVSDKCCIVSKKKPATDYYKMVGADLIITGERRAEGGQRATVHKSCFDTFHGRDKYMPLYFWDDDTKQWYKEHEGIKYSDCYEVWGMTRTGCVGCPFNSRAGYDLELLRKYEPALYKACMHVFGDSYRLMDEFGVRRHKILTHEEETK